MRALPHLPLSAGLALLLVLAAGCRSDTDAPSDAALGDAPAEAVSTGAPYALDVPGTWQRSDGPVPRFGGGTAVYTVGTPPEAVFTAIHTPRPAGRADLDGLIVGVEMVFRQRGGITLEANRPTTVGGVDGRDRTFTATVGGRPVRVRSVYLLSSSTFYVLSYTAATDLYTAHAAAAERAVASFRPAS